MSQDSVSLQWESYEAHHKSNYICDRGLFSDVTLVCDDQTEFQAHNIVINAFSPILGQVLLNNPHPYPLLYMRGVKQEDMI